VLPASSVTSPIRGLEDFDDALTIGEGVVKRSAEAGSNSTDRVGTL
jgi:hypothetical protein